MQNTSGSVYTPGAQAAPPLRLVDVGRVFTVIGSALQRERGRLNTLDSFGGAGTYGDRLARAFTQAGGTVRRAGTGDAGRDLELAAQVVGDVAGGQTGRYYSQGLRRAAPQFAGHSGLSLADLPALLTSLLEGVQENNPAKPGQSTLLDCLIPAVSAFVTSKKEGLSDAQAIQATLGAATMGRKRTARMTPISGGKGRAGREDPGAAGAEVIIAGLLRALVGGGPVEQPAGPAAIDPGLLIGRSGGPSFDILPPGFLTGGDQGPVDNLANLLSNVEPANTDPGGRDQTDYRK